MFAAAAARVERLAGRAGLRRFRASLAIENAVALTREHRFAPTLREMARAELISPLRVIGLAERLTTKLARADW